MYADLHLKYESVTGQQSQRNWMLKELFQLFVRLCNDFLLGLKEAHCFSGFMLKEAAGSLKRRSCYQQRSESLHVNYINVSSLSRSRHLEA